jgi:hypothetical protein
MFFITVLAICGVISGGLWLFGWVREKKDNKVAQRALAQLRRNETAPFLPKLDPGEYYTTCSKPLWAVLQTEFSCDILPESYRELEVMP